MEPRLAAAGRKAVLGSEGSWAPSAPQRLCSGSGATGGKAVCDFQASCSALQPQGERRLSGGRCWGPGAQLRHPPPGASRRRRSPGQLREVCKSAASAEVAGRGASCGLVTPAAPGARRAGDGRAGRNRPGRRRRVGRPGAPPTPPGARVCPPGCGLLSRAESQGPRCEAGVTPRTEAFFILATTAFRSALLSPEELEFSPEL